MVALAIAAAVFGAILAWLAIEAHQAPIGCDACNGVNDCWACDATQDRA